MKSNIFYTNKYKIIESNIKIFLNNYQEFLNKETVSSTRATGDAIQTILEENFSSILGDICENYSSKFARRAMADLAFTDKDNFYYSIDVKTHRLSTKFNMPNLTSVERLTRLYEDDTNYFIILMVEYTIDSMNIKIENVHFIPIEFLSWNCLTIGALGWGQIQIANASNIVINERYSRKKWMIELFDSLFDFYPREIEKLKVELNILIKQRKYGKIKKIFGFNQNYKIYKITHRRQIWNCWRNCEGRSILEKLYISRRPHAAYRSRAGKFAEAKAHKSAVMP